MMNNDWYYEGPQNRTEEDDLAEDAEWAARVDAEYEYYEVDWDDRDV